MKIAIFDLDGCLADDRRRRYLLPKHGTCDADYEAYHADCGNDPVANMELVEAHREAGCHLLFITSRPQKFLATTHGWLIKHFNLGDRFTLLMRPDGDRRRSRELKLALFVAEGFRWEDVVAAYDDRPDVLAAYAAAGAAGAKLTTAGPTVAGILREMGDTFEQRNAVYGDNYKMVGPIMRILFPAGIPATLLGSDQFHLFELKVVKLARFAISGLTHVDSIHDDAVYSAMIEHILWEQVNEHE